jgi:hypothetical protein
MRLRLSVFPTLFVFALAFWGMAEPVDPPAAAPLLVDDFENGRAGAYPPRWKYLERSTLEPKAFDLVMNDHEKFFIVQEPGNKVLRAYTENESQRISLVNGEAGYDFDWDLRTHPRLRWSWRANKLPVGASEEDKNDTGGAFYVTFDSKDWLRRPRTLKYTYSSTLPVGTVVKFGALRVIVVSTGADGHGDWLTIERDVVADYRHVFDREPPDRPVLITLWSDSNDTQSVAEVDFDNIELLPAR